MASSFLLLTVSLGLPRTGSLPSLKMKSGQWKVPLSLQEAISTSEKVQMSDAWPPGWWGWWAFPPLDIFFPNLVRLRR